MIGPDAFVVVHALCEQGDFPVTPDDVLVTGRQLGYKSNYTANRAIKNLFNPTEDMTQEVRLAIAGISYVALANRPEARAVSGASLARACLTMTIDRAVDSGRVADLLSCTASCIMHDLGIVYDDLP